jgi:crossover junction endodeoxyribonuclease RuvC
MPTFMGIDPGVNGAIASIILPGWELSVCNMPETPADFLELLRHEREWLDTVVLERVQPFRREKSGVVPAFRLGQSFGRIEGMLSALEVHTVTVTPQRWQRSMNCLTGGDKHVSKAKAQERFPGTKITLQNADAILIATYCAERFGFIRGRLS